MQTCVLDGPRASCLLCVWMRWWKDIQQSRRTQDKTRLLRSWPSTTPPWGTTSISSRGKGKLCRCDSSRTESCLSPNSWTRKRLEKWLGLHLFEPSCSVKFNIEYSYKMFTHTHTHSKKKYGDVSLETLELTSLILCLLWIRITPPTSLIECCKLKDYNQPNVLLSPYCDLQCRITNSNKKNQLNLEEAPWRGKKKIFA